MSVCTAESKFCYLPSSAVPSITSISKDVYVSRMKEKSKYQTTYYRDFLKFTTIHTTH